jgi:hypothetical protein
MLQGLIRRGLGWDGSALSGSVTNLAKNSGLKGGIFVAVLKCGSLRAAAMTLAFAALINCSAARAQSTTELPRLIHSQGRHALLVDGRPYLILGAQVNNSSNYPGMLPKVWPAIEQLQANTVLVPVAWEQVEARQGKFDLSTPCSARRANIACTWSSCGSGPGRTPAPATPPSGSNSMLRVIRG